MIGEEFAVQSVKHPKNAGFSDATFWFGLGLGLGAIASSIAGKDSAQTAEGLLCRVDSLENRPVFSSLYETPWV